MHASVSASAASSSGAGGGAASAGAYEVDKYDRQLRLWGAHGQACLNAARVCVLGAGPTGAQVLKGLVEQAGAINWAVTSVAVVTVLACVAAKRWVPRLPHMIVGMVVGSLVALALNHLLGAANTGIASIGALSIGLPPFSRPDFSLEALRQMAPIAAAVALLALTEAVSIARAMALKSGQRIDGNQEFVGQGLSNLVGSFFSGYASSGSFNRTGLNYASGAKTPLAAVFSAFFLLGLMLFLAQGRPGELPPGLAS